MFRQLFLSGLHLDTEQRSISTMDSETYCFTIY